MTTQPQPEALPPLPDPAAHRAECDEWVQYHDQHDPLPEQWDDKPDCIAALFTADQMRAYATEHAARLHAECEALRADAERWRFARDNIVAFYETTGHWRLYMLDGTIVYEGTASSYQGAIDAARAAKEQA